MGHGMGSGRVHGQIREAQSEMKKHGQSWRVPVKNRTSLREMVGEVGNGGAQRKM